MELKNYEFNAHGVDMGQFYQSAGIVRDDGSEKPEPARDPELYYQASTVPGAHLPHVWVGDAARKRSTLDQLRTAQYLRITQLIVMVKT
jgi:2,4-dichlorophenol 6-monooxygenase